jgi:hypothetical protein
MLFNTIDNCFDFLQKQQVADYNITLDVLLHYAGLDNSYGIELLQQELLELQFEANRSFSNLQLIPLLQIANTKNYEAVKIMVRTLPQDATAQDMIALLEDIEGRANDRAAAIKVEEE